MNKIGTQFRKFAFLFNDRIDFVSMSYVLHYFSSLYI